MKNRIIILVLLILSLVSCGDRLIKKDDLMDSNYVITDIERYSKYYSIYYAETGHDYVVYKDNIHFIDNKGKFLTGDTIQIKTELFKDTIKITNK